MAILLSVFPTCIRETMTFNLVSYDRILPFAATMSDNRILSVMDAYLGRILDGHAEQMKLHYSSDRYVDLTRRINHCSYKYRTWLSYIFSERSWQVWAEHFNRWPSENDCLPPMYKSEPQAPAYLPQPR